MYYECRKCNRRFEELEKLGKLKFCGDFWKCTDCNNDITKDLKSWYKEIDECFSLMRETILRPEFDNDLYLNTTV